ncbi:MAG TPA: polyprenyl synthetase family protein [Mycobacteriales bacterium]|jgi:geranylgeranyl diphosphate synthase type I|nr:polyprenyl synthetase family protein [Mycobacteriales bacterium]
MTIAMPSTVYRSRDLVEPALRAAIARLDDTSRHVASYHFGWVEADGRPTEVGGGKALRPALALLSAQVATGAAEVGVPGAVAVELVHNFSLLHDDVMDGDMQRRHRATVWAVWGTSTAILVGDAMLALAHQVLADAGTEASTGAQALLGAATQELIRGQLADLAFEQRPSVTVTECVSMAADKTGSLLGCSAAIGAVLGGAPPATVAALQTYGEQIGLAFQLVDDLLGIWGDEAVTGKPVGSDLRARKKSLPISYAIGSDTVAGRELAGVLGCDADLTDDQVAAAAGLVEAAGGRGWARQEAQRRLVAACRVLDSVVIDSSVRDELVALGRFIVEREQ